MATYLTPPPPIYDPQASSSQEYYGPYPNAYTSSCQAAHVTSSQYYSQAEELPADYFVDAPNMSAIPNNDQAPVSHPLYGEDASAAAMTYTTEHALHLQPRFYSDAHQPRTLYEAGEVSPLSDDSAGTYYDSPQPYEHARLSESYSYYERASAPLQHSRDGYATTYDYEQLSPVAFEDNEYTSYSHAYCGDNNPPMQPQLFSSSVSPSDYTPRYPSRYLAKQQQLDAPVQSGFRSESPMGHLPYSDPRGSVTEGYASSSSYESSDTSRQSSIERPQPRSFNSERSLQLLAHHPPPIAIPAPRSPPIVEDTPKKPLTLACYFCRKRKIACGSPAPGKKDRTCNQCARRNLRCEYPVNSRRGTRQREGEGLSYPS